MTLLLLVGGLLLSMASPATAHDDIVSAYPEPGATVGVVPEEIMLTFSGEILTETSAVIIEVIAPDGQNVASGAPIIDGTTVTQPLVPAPVAGTFTVRWRVVSSDGHPISGEYAYTVEPLTVPSTPTATATAESTPEPSPTETTASEAHPGASGGGQFLPILAVLTGVIVVGGALIIVLMMGRERRRRDRAAAAATRGTDADTRSRAVDDAS